MKKVFCVISILLVLAVLAFAGPTGPFPNKEFGQDLGKDGRSYNDLYLKNSIYFEGATGNSYETRFFAADATADRTAYLPDYTGALLLSALITNAPDVANSIWGVSNGITFEGATANDYEGTITVADITADRTYTLPDASGTVVVNCGASHDYSAGNTDWSMTIGDSACGYISTTNAGNATNAILPSCVAGKFYDLYNTSGANVTLKVTGQTGAVVATAKHGLFVCNGTDVLQIYATP